MVMESIISSQHVHTEKHAQTDRHNTETTAYTNSIATAYHTALTTSLSYCIAFLVGCNRYPHVSNTQLHAAGIVTLSVAVQ